VAESANIISPETIPIAEEAQTVSYEPISVPKSANIISLEPTPVAEEANIISLEPTPVAEAANIISLATKAANISFLEPTLIVAEAQPISPETTLMLEIADVISPEMIPIAEAADVIFPEIIPIAEAADVITPVSITIAEAADIISLESVIMDKVTKVAEECKESQDSSNVETVMECKTFEVLLDILLNSEEAVPESKIGTSVSKTPGIGENHHKLDAVVIEDYIQVVEGPLQPHETRKSLSDLLSTHDTTEKKIAILENTLGHIMLPKENKDETTEVLVTQYPDEEVDCDNCSTMTNSSNNEPRLHSLDFIQILSYKSAAGIFVMDIINFIRNENIYPYDNMRTSLRHLLELLTIEDDIVTEACSVINIENLIRIVKTCISNSGDSAKCSEIFSIIEDIENITNEKKKH